MNRLMNLRTGYTTIAALTLAAGLAGAAYAGNDRETVQRASSPATAGAESTPLTMDEVLARLRIAGYSDFAEVEREKGRYEVKGRDAEGRRVELYVDARDGKVLEQKRHD